MSDFRSETPGEILAHILHPLLYPITSNYSRIRGRSGEPVEIVSAGKH